MCSGRIPFSMLISHPSNPYRAAMPASRSATASAAAIVPKAAAHVAAPASHSVMKVPSTCRNGDRKAQMHTVAVRPCQLTKLKAASSHELPHCQQQHPPHRMAIAYWWTLLHRCPLHGDKLRRDQAAQALIGIHKAEAEESPAQETAQARAHRASDGLRWHLPMAQRHGARVDGAPLWQP